MPQTGGRLVGFPINQAPTKGLSATICHSHGPSPNQKGSVCSLVAAKATVLVFTWRVAQLPIGGLAWCLEVFRVGFPIHRAWQPGDVTPPTPPTSKPIRTRGKHIFSHAPCNRSRGHHGQTMGSHKHNSWHVCFFLLLFLLIMASQVFFFPHFILKFARRCPSASSRRASACFGWRRALSL